MNVLDFAKYKAEGRKISMVTCYDYTSAAILGRTEVDCLLVGDSAAMVMHGHSSTLAATPELMALHTAAVARGAGGKFVVGDLPFPSFRKGIAPALESVDLLMKAGAHAVKLEGVEGHEDVVRQIVGSGVPVMGHLGLTPQSVHAFGGFKVQGREESDAERIKRQARTLVDLGCFSIVLECVPAELAAEISRMIPVPTIGIGAGPGTDGQVLVLPDLLGLTGGFRPKFLKTYLNGAEQFTDAVNRYANEVREGVFPTEKESYT